jgi:hypothetical protein
MSCVAALCSGVAFDCLHKHWYYLAQALVQLVVGLAVAPNLLLLLLLLLLLCCRCLKALCRCPPPTR